MEPLHMIRLVIDEIDLFECERRLALAPKIPSAHHRSDFGYVAHCYLMGLFGEKAPRPFWLDVRRDTKAIQVLGYAQCDAETLKADAQTFADPGIWSAVDWGQFASKPMPTKFAPGQRLGFAVSTIPSVCIPRSGRKRIDPYLRKTQLAPDGVQIDRFDVYQRWLYDGIDRAGGAKVLDSRVVRFSLDKMTRRTQITEEEKRRKVQRFFAPSVTLEGVLEVMDSEKFFMLLTRGIGRHKAFGAGMLRLKRA